MHVTRGIDYFSNTRGSQLLVFYVFWSSFERFFALHLMGFFFCGGKKKRRGKGWVSKLLEGNGTLKEELAMKVW